MSKTFLRMNMIIGEIIATVITSIPLFTISPLKRGSTRGGFLPPLVILIKREKGERRGGYVGLFASLVDIVKHSVYEHIDYTEAPDH